MTFAIDHSATIEAIRLAYNSGDWTAAYDLVIGAITDAGGDPLNGVDDAVALWIQGARNVNADQGAFAGYIRDYTARQVQELRSGQSLEPSVLDATSDMIAMRFVATLFGALTEPSQDPPATLVGTYSALVLPTLSEIGNIDAASAAAGIFKDISGLPNYSPWAGTPLFAYFGDGSFLGTGCLRLAPANLRSKQVCTT